MDKLRNDGKLKKEVFEKDEYYVEVGEVFRDEVFEWFLKLSNLF